MSLVAPVLKKDPTVDNDVMPEEKPKVSTEAVSEFTPFQCKVPAFWIVERDEEGLIVATCSLTQEKFKGNLATFNAAMKG